MERNFRSAMTNVYSVYNVKDFGQQSTREKKKSTSRNRTELTF